MGSRTYASASCSSMTTGTEQLAAASNSASRPIAPGSRCCTREVAFARATPGAVDAAARGRAGHKAGRANKARSVATDLHLVNLALDTPGCCGSSATSARSSAAARVETRPIECDDDQPPSRYDVTQADPSAALRRRPRGRIASGTPRSLRRAPRSRQRRRCPHALAVLPCFAPISQDGTAGCSSTSA